MEAEDQHKSNRRAIGGVGRTLPRNRWVLYAAVAFLVTAMAGIVFLLSRSEELGGSSSPSKLHDVPEGWHLVGAGENVLLFSDKEQAMGYESSPRTYLEEHSDHAFVQIGSYSLGIDTAAGTVAKGTDVEDFVKRLYGAESIIVSRPKQVNAGPGVEFNVRWGVTPGDTPIGEISVKEFWLWMGDDLTFVAQRRGLESKSIKEIDAAYESIIASLKRTG